MAGKKIEEGDKVAWNWGGGEPGGEATKVSEDDVKMETKRGNEVTKKGESGNPAVYIERSGHDVVKKANELKVKAKGSGKKQSGSSGSQSGSKKEASETPSSKQSSKKQSESSGSKQSSHKPSSNGVKKRQSAKANSGNARTRRSNRIAAKSQ